MSAAGEVRVEGAYVGRLDGLRFVPDAIDGVEMRMLNAAANRVLRSEVAARAQLLAADADSAFALDPAGMLRWRGGPVGRLVAGERMLTPRAEPLAGDFIEGEARDKIRQRLAAFVRAEIERRLAPLFAASALPLGGLGRGLAFQLAEALGALPAAAVAAEVAALAPADRAALGRLGVRFGVEQRLFRDRCCDPRRCAFAACCGRCGTGGKCRCCRRRGGSPRRSQIDPGLPPSFYAALGFFVAGDLALRPDRLERLAAAARRLARDGPFAADAAARLDRRDRARRAAAAVDRSRLSRGDRRRRRDVCRAAAPPPRSGRAKPSASAAGGPSIRQAAGIEAGLSAGALGPEAPGRRLDQWLWFARLAKSRSLAARLCAAGAVTVNGVAARKANHPIRIGDIVAVPQGPFQRRVRVLALGARRGPAVEARQLYEDIAAPIRRADLAPAWEPLLADSDLDPHY